jgi:hypothetical protein
MGDISEKRILIKSTSGGEIGELLHHCYFKLKPDGTYTFHDKDDHVKARKVTVGGPGFSFRLDENPAIEWHLTLNSDASEQLDGSWRNGQDPAMADGEYQAQAGGSEEEEDASAASAGYAS